MDLRRRSSPTLQIATYACLAMLAPLTASAQGSPQVDRLDIRGNVLFPNNADFPDLVGTPPCSTIADQAKIAGGSFQADLIPPGSGALQSFASARNNGGLTPPPWLGPFSATTPSPDGVNFTLAVGVVQAGTAYRLSGNVRFDGGNDTYWFDPVSTGPITPSTLPFCAGSTTVRCLLTQDFSECAGVVHVVFADLAGNPIDCASPAYPTSGDVVARQLIPSPGPNEPADQASSKVQPGFELRFPVQAGICASGCTGNEQQEYRVTVVVQQGSNPFCTTFSFSQTFEDDPSTQPNENVVVRCGQVTTLEVRLPPAPDDPCCSPSPPPECTNGQPELNWQVLEFENDVVYNAGVDSDPALVMPRVTLDRGAHGNYRLGRVSPPPGPDRSYPALGSFELRNVPLSSNYPNQADKSQYRIWSYHVLNDDAHFAFDPVTGRWNPVAGGPTSHRGRPCSPTLDVDGDTLADPCGRVSLVRTTFGEGDRANAVQFTAGEHLWETCLSAPPTDVPIRIPDSEMDWLFIDQPVPLIHRCPVFLALPGACTGEITPRPQGLAPLSPADEVKPFVMDPAVLTGSLTIRDGNGTDSPLGDIAEFINPTVAVLDPAYPPTFLASYIDTIGFRHTSASCANLNGADTLGQSAACTSSLLYNANQWPLTDTHGRREYAYRIAPSEIGNVSAWYYWNRVRLNFASGNIAAESYLNGDTTLNNDPLASDLRSVELPYGPPLTDTMDYCLGKLVVFVESTNADIAPGHTSFIVGGNTTAPAAGEPDATFHFAGSRLTGNTRVVRFNAALPAGDYAVTPFILFDQATGVTKFPVIIPCAVECGKETRVCSNNAPSVTGPSAFSVPLDGSCHAAASVTLCIYDCNGVPTPPASTVPVTVAVCSDTDQLTPTPLFDAAQCDAPTGGAAPFLVQLLAAQPVSNDPNNCSPLTLSNLPARDGHGYSVTYHFVVTDEPSACSQPQALTSLFQVEITSVDLTPPSITCPAATVLCTNQLTAAASPCASNVYDNCPLTPPQPTWLANNGAVPASGAGLCAGVTCQLGTTTVTWTVTDAAGLTTSCSSPVEVHSVPRACIDPHIPVLCRNGATLTMPLTTACTQEDLNPDPFTDPLTYVWSTAGACSASPTDQPSTTISITDPGECLSEATCTVTLVVSKPIAGCSSTTSTTIVTAPRPTASAGGPYAVCMPLTGPATIQLSGSGDACGGGTLSYAWTQPTCAGGSLANANTATPTFSYSGTDPCASCDVTLTVTSSAHGCQSASATGHIDVRFTPVASPGGPYTGCTALGSATQVQLDGSSTPGTACSGCQLMYQWSFQNCTGVSPVDPTGPNPTVMVDADACTGDQCEACLTVTHCAGCVSTKVCAPFVFEPKPDAGFCYSIPLNACRQVQYTNQSVTAACAGPVTCQWTFPTDGTPASSTSCPGPLVSYATCGLKDTSLTVTQDPCTDTATLPCQVCVPECTSVTPPSGPFEFLIKCADGFSPCDVTATPFQPVFHIGCVGKPGTGCCPLPGNTLSLVPGGSMTLTIGPCALTSPPGTTVTRTSTVPLTGIELANGQFDVTGTFTQACIYNMVKALGCRCALDSVIPVTISLNCELQCSSGCKWPFNISGSPAIPIQIRCVSSGTRDCLNTPTLPPSCPDTSCTSITPPPIPCGH